MKKTDVYSLRFVFAVVVVLWVFYFLKMIDYRQARSLTLGVLAGGVLGLVTIRLLRRSRK